MDYATSPVISQPATAYMGAGIRREPTDAPASVPHPDDAPVAQSDRASGSRPISRAGKIAGWVGGLTCAAVLGGVGGKVGGLYPGLMGAAGGLLLMGPISLGVVEGARAWSTTRAPDNAARESTGSSRQHV